jgi:hypothetical protein
MRFRCKCGHEWASSFQNVFRQTGCPQCALLIPRRTVSALDIARRCEKLAEREIWMISICEKVQNKARFQCRNGHQWSAQASSVFRGNGCPDCATYGFQARKSAIVYYVRFDLACGSFWKIGVTNRTVAARFRTFPIKPTIIKIWSFAVGADACELEQRILLENSFDQYRGSDVLPGGNNELFTCDVLGLDVREPKLALAN